MPGGGTYAAFSTNPIPPQSIITGAGQQGYVMTSVFAPGTLTGGVAQWRPAATELPPPPQIPNFPTSLVYEDGTTSGDLPGVRWAKISESLQSTQASTLVRKQALTPSGYDIVYDVLPLEGISLVNGSVYPPATTGMVLTRGVDSAYWSELTTTLPPLTTDGTVLTTITSGGDLAVAWMQPAPTVITDGSVTTPKLADSAITTIKINDGAVTSSKVATGAIGTTQVGALAITSAKIANGAVGTTQIATSAVTNAQLATSSVGTANIISGAANTVLTTNGSSVPTWASINTANIADGSITSIKIASGNVTATQIGTGAVTTAKILPGANNTLLTTDGSGIPTWATTIGTTNIADSSVTNAKIVSGAVTNAKLAVSSVNTTNIVPGANDTVLITNGVGVPSWTTVGTQNIADASITTSKIATGAVSTATIGTAAITPVKIAPGSNTTVLTTNGSGVPTWASTLGSSNLGTGSVTSTQIANGAVGSSQLATAAVTPITIAPGTANQVLTTDGSLAVTWANPGTPSVPDGSITTAKLADGAVTNIKLGALAVDTGNIVNAAVTTSKIGALAVSAGQLNVNSVSVSNIIPDVTDGSVMVTTSGQAQWVRINTVNINNNAVTTLKINDAAITNSKLDVNSVDATTNIIAGAASSVLTTTSGGTTAWTASLPVIYGGIGKASCTAYSLLTGGTTSTGALQSLASVGSAGQILQSSGAGALPIFTSAVYPSSTTINQLLFSSSSNTVSGLVTANNAVLVTNGSGVPSWSTSALPVTNGGTGRATGGSINALVATGSTLVTDPQQSIANGPTAGQILQSTGTSTLPSYSTATYPSATTANQLLYSSALNTVSGLATANNAILVTNGSGVPSLSTAAIGVANGGTGRTSNTAYALIAGGTTATTQQSITTGTSGQLLQSNGASAIPSYTTATYPTATTINQILYSSAANVVSGIASANNAIMVTNASGVPSFSTAAILVANGGTGRTSLGVNQVLIGGTTSTGSTQSITNGSSGTLLQSTGTSSAPIFGSVVFPTSTTPGQILYTGATPNLIQQIANPNYQVLTTDGVGAPAFRSSLPNVDGSALTNVVAQSVNKANIPNSSMYSILVGNTGTGNTTTYGTSDFTYSTSSGIILSNSAAFAPFLTATAQLVGYTAQLDTDSMEFTYYRMPSAPNTISGEIIHSCQNNGTGTLKGWRFIGGGIALGASASMLGNGTLNVQTDIYKNGTAYNNPDYVLEIWRDGEINKFKENEGAEGYMLLSIEETEKVMKSTLKLPRMDSKPKGMFDRSDFLLEKLEEAFIYIIQLNKRIAYLESIVLK